MTARTPTGVRQFGDGPLSRITGLLYTLLVVDVLMILLLAPSLALLTFLARDASNLPLAALAAVPLGPALAGGLIALRRPRDLGDLRPAAGFRQGLRTGTVPVLRVWVPALVLFTVLGVNLTHLDAAGLSGAWAAPLVVVGVAALVWAVQAVVIAALFSFRTRDVARLAWYFVFRTPGVAAGVAALAVVAAAVVVAASEAVLLLGAAIGTLLLLVTCRPMIEVIEHEFVALPPVSR